MASECGCGVSILTQKVQFCPLHSKAREMRETLLECQLTEHIQNCSEEMHSTRCEELRALLEATKPEEVGNWQRRRDELQRAKNV